MHDIRSDDDSNGFIMNCSQFAKGSRLGVKTSSLCALAHHLSGLVSTQTSTPVTALLLVLVSAVDVWVSIEE